MNKLIILKSYFKLIYISLIGIIFSYIQISYTYANTYQYLSNIHKPPVLSYNIDQYVKNQHTTTIYAQSNNIEINYPNHIQLIGNVHITHDNTLITSDRLTILYNKNNYSLYTAKLYATGNVHYQNNYLLLRGSSAQFDFNKKHIKLYQGTYYIHKFNIYGQAQSIMHNESNHYTIINQGKISTCAINKNSWNINGSHIIYHHNTNDTYIWNAYFKIKQIPILYIPYLSFSLNNKDILQSYIPNIRYNNQHGLTLKIPFPLAFSKYYFGNITPYYSSKSGIKLQTQIHYSYKPGTGIITINILQKNSKNTDLHHKSYRLYWKHNSFIHKKWHCNIDYISDHNLFHLNNIKNNHMYSANNYINQKILFYYNNKNWKTSIAYLGNSYFFSNNLIQKNCTYIAAPQLELHFYSNIKQQKKLINFHIFNQFSRFIPSNYFYPTSIRIHTEPSIRCTINNFWSYFYAESKLFITHYRQNNTPSYNISTYSKFYLNNTITRIVPNLKIQGKMFFKKKSNINKKYKHFLEPQLQYLYIPYCFQKNIGIYDTKMIYTNHSNLFHGTTYSGLDRIGPINQIITNIISRCFKEHSELFYISIGHILNFTQHNIVNDINSKKCSYLNTPNITLLSGIGHWNINHYWNTHTEIQYCIPSHKLFSGNSILEHVGKNNQIFRINYRYINSEYLQKNFIHCNQSLYYQTISQLGIIVYYPLINNWTISYTQYYNTRSTCFIDQAIGIQHFNPCWIFSVLFERKIINWNNLNQSQIYDNKIQLHLNLHNLKSHSRKNLTKILQCNLIPYQKIFEYKHM